MSNTLEQLYKLANVKSIDFAALGVIDFAGTIEIDNKRYPAFSEAKQLRLLKCLVSNGWNTFKLYYADKKYTTLLLYKQGYTAAHWSDFEEALANLIVELWLKLEDDLKEKIKDILQTF